jgi:ribose 5-phosphate isomerase B
MKIKKVYLASDHAGFELKEKVKKYLEEKKYEIKDMGAYKYDADDDYPDFIKPAARKISVDSNNTCAIIFGGSGQGEAMVANRFPNVRCAVFYGGKLPTQELNIEGKTSDDPLDFIKLSRTHNDTNMLSIGARFITFEEVKEVIDLWLNADFEGGRHERRVKKIDS